jgi:hypothetical protein
MSLQHLFCWTVYSKKACSQPCISPSSTTVYCSINSIIILYRSHADPFPCKLCSFESVPKVANFFPSKFFNILIELATPQRKCSSQNRTSSDEIQIQPIVSYSLAEGTPNLPGYGGLLYSPVVRALTYQSKGSEFETQPDPTSGESSHRTQMLVKCSLEVRASAYQSKASAFKTWPNNPTWLRC